MNDLERRLRAAKPESLLKAFASYCYRMQSVNDVDRRSTLRAERDMVEEELLRRLTADQPKG